MDVDLKEKIDKKQAVVGIIGLCYVGLPLLLEFIEQGFTSIGFDIDKNKINILEKGKTYIKHISQERIKMAVNRNTLTVTTDFSQLKKSDCIIVAVPTPLDKHHQPDLTFIEKTSETITKYLRKEQLVVLESSNFPGTTEEIMRPILEKSGLKY